MFDRQRKRDKVSTIGSAAYCQSRIMKGGHDVQSACRTIDPREAPT